MHQTVYLYKCNRDTLLLTDSTLTNEKGKFAFKPFSAGSGLYKVALRDNQSFYILNDGTSIEIQTVFVPDFFSNIATDSLVFLRSKENRRFLKFQQLQQQVNVANYFLLQMMRLYPLQDPFHHQLEDEYFKRYHAMEKFVKKQISSPGYSGSMAAKIALAYYLPVIPDWKQPDNWRDSIIAYHYFDHFKPADSFYLHTNILPEKMDIYLALRTNLRDAYGQPIREERFFSEAAGDFLEKTLSIKQNQSSVIGKTGMTEPVFQFCLNYYLKKFNKEHKENAFLSIYDTYLTTREGDCGSSETDEFTWARKKADVYKNVQAGSIAPDFFLQDSSLNLASIQSDFTLLIFWATWCPHCTSELPEIKKVTDSINLKPHSSNQKLTIIAISLDTDQMIWQKYVKENGLINWFHTSEFKGWEGDVIKQYNVYATPTMFLLDKNKKIIQKPFDSLHLKEILVQIL